MPTPQTAVPWRIYLLIDPTTGPTNHPLGTIFYVGLRADLRETVDLREVTEPESLPGEEGAARGRLEHLNREGVRVVVEVVPEQWGEVSRPPGLPRVVGTLCAALHPAPLNERLKSVRWPASLAQAVEGADVVRLPESGAILRLHKGGTPVAHLPLLDDKSLYEESLRVVEGRDSPRAISNTLKQGGPLPLLLVAEGRTGRGVLPGGFVLGAWMAEAIEPLNEKRTEWQVVLHDDPGAVGALRRRYLHQLVSLDDLHALKLRKA